MKKWKREEIDMLVEHYNKLSNEELQKMFPTKSFLAIYKKAYSLGLRKTKEIEFLNRSVARKGEKGSNWNGGKRRTAKGYIQVKSPNHPRADMNGYVMEHILVFEEKTGLIVPLNCCIHHLNGIKDDNRIENLCMMENGSHTSFHNSHRKAVNQHE